MLLNFAGRELQICIMNVNFLKFMPLLLSGLHLGAQNNFINCDEIKTCQSYRKQGI